MKKFNFASLYLLVLIIAFLFMITACGTCPGTQNLVTPREYTAIDFLDYPDAGFTCILSKLNNFDRQRRDLWTGNLNQQDYITFSVSDSDQLVYFKLTHVATNFEHIRTQYARYMRFFRDNGFYYQHTKGLPSFKCEYMGWTLSVDLRSEYLYITAARLQF